MIKRSFEEMLSTLKSSITPYDFFVDFNKVFKNVKELEILLNSMNYLLGKEDFDQAFKDLFEQNSNIYKAIPILLATRENKIEILEDKLVIYDFMHAQSVDDYLMFIKNTNLIKLFTKDGVKNLVDYVIGVEVGLDTNSRKNRTGTLMENKVEKFIKDSVVFKDYITQARIIDIKNNLGIDLSYLLDVDQNKRFDFAVKSQDKLFLIETNYYRTSGSKLNETARSYTKLSEDISKIDDVYFIWITDGQGWLSTKNNFEEAYDHIDYLFNLYDLEQGILKELFFK